VVLYYTLEVVCLYESLISAYQTIRCQPKRSNGKYGVDVMCNFKAKMYRGAGKSLARPTSRFILFDGENISFDASLVIYINSTNIPPIMILNRIYETQNLLSL
jgi:hypothetical protein